jgi:predicted nucleic acid-binding protein
VHTTADNDSTRRDISPSHRSRRFGASLIDLHDCLLDAVAQERHTRVLSFDRDLHELGHAERP